MSDDDPEIEYLRAVEDLFSTLRGVPHMLSPKDMQLARELWREGIQLAAISAGVSQAIDRKRSSGNDEPVTSLSYCRHAIRSNSKRLSEQQVGAHSTARQSSAGDTRDLAQRLVGRLDEIAATENERRPLVASVVGKVARELEAARESDQVVFESLAFGLETALLESCWTALLEVEKQPIRDAAEQAARSSGARGTAHERAYRAFRDREIRSLLNLPRLEFE